MRASLLHTVSRERISDIQEKIDFTHAAVDLHKRENECASTRGVSDAASRLQDDGLDAWLGDLRCKARERRRWLDCSVWTHVRRVVTANGCQPRVASGEESCPVLPPDLQQQQQQQQQQGPSCTHHRTTAQRWTTEVLAARASAGCFQARAAVDKPRQARMWSDGRRELLLGMVILLLLSSGKTSKTSTAGDKAHTTRLEESSRSLRWGQGCSYHYLSSLLFRPCRCIKPNAQASRDPPPIRCPISKQHTAPATEHSTTCNLHWPNTALYQTATSWRQLLTAVKSRALASFRPCLLCKSRCCLAKCPSPPKVARLDFDARIP
jgi:hypothetical protein